MASPDAGVAAFPSSLAFCPGPSIRSTSWWVRGKTSRAASGTFCAMLYDNTCIQAANSVAQARKGMDAGIEINNTHTQPKRRSPDHWSPSSSSASSQSAASPVASGGATKLIAREPLETRLACSLQKRSSSPLAFRTHCPHSSSHPYFIGGVLIGTFVTSEGESM